MTVQVHNIEQRTDEWHAWRKEHGTASNAPCIMKAAAFAPYTWRQLIEVMTGVREIWVTSAMRRGSEAEEKIQELYEATTGEGGYAMCLSNGFLGASLDWGYMPDPFGDIERAAEFKTPNKGSESPLWKAETVDDVPMHIRFQIQHQYLVSEAQQIDLVVYAHDLDKIKIIPIPSDRDCQGALREQWDEFWHYYLTGTLPPAQPRDIREIKDQELNRLLLEYRKVCDQMADLKSNQESLKEDIFKYADESSVSCNGIVVERVVRKGNVDWKELCEDQQLHDSLIEKFRKPSTVYHKIRNF